MVGFVYPSFSSFMLGEPSVRPAVRQERGAEAFILTWRTGYEQALQDAANARSKGLDPVLLKLSNQASPPDEVWRAVRDAGMSLLTVASRFAKDGPTSQGLRESVEKARKQSRLGLVRRTGPAHAPPSHSSVTPTTTRVLTDDERQEYARAMYGNPDDDGVR